MLTPKQALFVQEYLVDLNATQAALRAGYAKRTAYSIGQANLKKHEIAVALQDAQKARSQRTAVTADRVLLEIARLAYVDVRQLYDADGRLRSIPDLEDDIAAAVSGIEVFEEWAGPPGEKVPVGQTKKIRLWNKTANLTLLGKHLGLFAQESVLDAAFLDMLAKVVLKYVSSAQDREEIFRLVEERSVRPILRDVTPVRAS